MALTRERIVGEAVDLLDELGLEGLTLRRLAERLKVQAPSLYWHVRDKRQLLDWVAEEIAGRSADRRLPTPGEPWWEWLADGSRRLRRALLSHRDAALVVSGNRPSPAVLPHVEARLAVLVDAGFSPRDALMAVLSLSAYVVGEVLEVQADAERQPGVAPAVAARAAEPDLPNLQAAMRGGGMGGGEERFEHGLATMIAGLRARFETS